MSTTNTEQILEISLDVNDLLSQYVTIHNDVFKASIRRIIPVPGIFKAIDFGAHLAKTECIINELKQCDDEIKSLIPGTIGQELEYLISLSRYTDALVETVSLLRVVLGPLYSKSQNIIDPNYRLDKHKDAIAKYKQSVKEYSAIGGPLNELFARIT